MSNSVIKILERLRAEGEHYTHTSMMAPHGKFYIGKEVQDTFFETYCEYIEETEDPMLGITERPKAIMPLLVDIDLKIDETSEFEFDSTTRLYTTKQLMHIVKLYQNVLKDVLDNYKDEHLFCFVLEKDPYIKNIGDKRQLKNGFHLHFPYVFLHKDEISTYIIPRVKDTIKKDLFKGIGITDASTVIDDAVTRNNWLMYGCKKSEKEKAYFLTKIFDKNEDTIELEEALVNYTLYDSDEQKIDIHDREYYYLPKILSIIPNGRSKLNIKNTILTLFTEKKKENKRIIRTFNEAVATKQLKEAKIMVSFLSKERSENYSSWIQVMWSLYNISNGSEDGLSLFLEFSKKAESKYDEDNCIKLWEKNTFNESGIGMGSLVMWAKKDSPRDFEKMVSQRSLEHVKFMTNALSGGHNDFAKALKEKYGDTFVCASITGNLWYEFRDNKWQITEEGHSLKTKIADYLVPLITDQLKKTAYTFDNVPDDGLAEISKNPNELKLKYYCKIINCLKSAPFKSHIMKEAKEVFYDKEFLNKLNKNPLLVGFKNGIYDLKTNTFREGLPDDYISMSMGVNYKEFTETSEEVTQVYEFLEKIFPDKELRDYFLTISSDIFEGGNKYKKVYFWSGEGDNGKSITQLIFEKMLGDYAKKLPTSIITGKMTQSSAATPELVRLGNGVRWCVADEPDKKDELNIGTLKRLSGNDTLYARAMFKEGSEIQPMFKLVVICNDPPKIPQSDKATWNRIRVFPFESTFCDIDKCPPTYEQQLLEKKFPKDPYFDEKIPGMVEAFAWVLLNHRKKNPPRYEPRKVFDATEMYRVKNDTYKMFINDMLIKEDDTYITLYDLYSSFKAWYRESMSTGIPPSKEELKEYLTKNYTSQFIASAKLKGFRFRNRDDNYE